MSDPSQVLEIVAKAWCEVLQTERVEAQDEFFSLGGDSMSALELITRVERRLGIEFPLDVLFLDGTFAAVVNACSAPGSSQ